MCLNEQVEFGIVLNNNGKMSDIGCKAKVFDLIKRYPDGKMDIAVQGGTRFSVKHIVDGEQPYLEAEIETIQDVSIDINAKLLYELVDIYNDIVKHLGAIELNPIDKTKLTDKFPSFVIAQKAGLTLQQRQILLSTLNENTRLEMLREHLIQLRPMVYKHEMIEQIIKNDGYLKNGLSKGK
jgi:Lon protease-like protein